LAARAGPQAQERNTLVLTKPPSGTATATAAASVAGEQSSLTKPVLVIMLVAFAVLLPTFFLGIPSGHDFEFHVNSWMEVVGQWRQGILYPRWAALAHHGFGEARFVFYPPASWLLGAALGSILPWKVVPGVYEWIALTLSGISMWLLARRFLNPRDALFAAALYAVNPYHLVIVYWRSAFAELLAGAALPLLLLYLLRSEEDGRKTILPLGLILGAVWLTNVPSAVMVTYSLVLLASVLALLRRSPRTLVIAFASLGLGFLLSAFYLVPTLYEQNWVEIAQVLSPGVRPQDNFLYTIIADADHNRFNLLVSVVATVQFVLLAVSVFASRRWRRRFPQLWWPLLAWCAVATMFMFSFSFPLYRVLPELRFVQLPWRWLLCMNVAFALLVTMAVRPWILRILACVAMIAALMWVWYRVQPPWWDNKADVFEMLDNQLTGAGYEGTDEYVPTGADAYEINKDARKVIFEGEGNSRIRVTQWAPESRAFSANVTQPGKLVLKLFNYPAWKAEVNGQAVDTGTIEVTGQMTIPVEPGDNQVRVIFTRTRDRMIGGLISFMTVLLLLGWIFVRRILRSSRPLSSQTRLGES
jgi:hypothetical protein